MRKYSTALLRIQYGTNLWSNWTDNQDVSLKIDWTDWRLLFSLSRKFVSFFPHSISWLRLLSYLICFCEFVSEGRFIMPIIIFLNWLFSLLVFMPLHHDLMPTYFTNIRRMRLNMVSFFMICWYAKVLDRQSVRKKKRKRKRDGTYLGHMLYAFIGV